MDNLLLTLTALITPTTLGLGMLISKGLESTSWFKRADFPSVLKFLLVMATSLASAIILALFDDAGLPTTLVGWRMVLLTGIAIALGSQIFHLLIDQYIPGLGDFLINLKTPGTVTVTQTSTTPGASTSVTTQDITKTQDQPTPTPTPIIAPLVVPPAPVFPAHDPGTAG